MGLDLYVMPLSDFYSGLAESPITRVLGVEPIRIGAPKPDLPPDEGLQIAHDLQAYLSAKAGQTIHWEDKGACVVREQFHYECYHALTAYAAYLDYPDPFNEGDDHPFKLVENVFVQPSLQKIYHGAKTRFPHLLLHGDSCYVPCDFPEPIALPEEPEEEDNDTPPTESLAERCLQYLSDDDLPLWVEAILCAIGVTAYVLFELYRGRTPSAVFLIVVLIVALLWRIIPNIRKLHFNPPYQTARDRLVERVGDSHCDIGGMLDAFEKEFSKGVESGATATKNQLTKLGLDENAESIPLDRIGSSQALLVELDIIGAELGMSRDWGALRSGESVASEEDPLGAVKTGWAILHYAARMSVEHKLPIVFDG